MKKIMIMLIACIVLRQCIAEIYQVTGGNAFGLVSLPAQMNGEVSYFNSDIISDFHSFSFTVPRTERIKVTFSYSKIFGGSNPLFAKISYYMGDFVSSVRKDESIYIDVIAGARFLISIEASFIDAYNGSAGYSYRLTIESVIVDSPPAATDCKVFFNANGGSVSPSSKTVSKGSSVGALPTPTRSGYTFDGWYTSASGGTKISSTTAINGDVTYYAHWTAIPLSPEYNVYFDADGGSASFNIKLVARGETVGSLPTATMDGYIFDGWYTAKSGGVKVTTSSIITKDVTYYAHWCYEVVFSGNGGMATENRRILPKGSRLGFLPTATRNGYEFTGWYSEVNVKTSGPIVVQDSKVSESTIGKPDESGSLVLYAGWSLIRGGFDLRFGTPAGRKWTQGFFLSADENATTGMTSFSDGDVIYWNSFIYNDGTEVIDGDFVVEHSICDAAGRYIISFNQYESLEYKPNTGYVRANQRWDEGFQSLPPGAYIYECIIDSHNNIPETGDLELNDRIEYPFTIVQDGQRVRFDSNGGSLNETSRCVSKNSSIGNLPVPVRSGYSFDGWYTSPIGGSKITSSTIVYGEATYYARWIALRKVIFNANGGEVSLGTKTVLDGEVIGSLPVPTRNGFRFNGWYSLTDGRRVYENMCVNSDMTLYAYWVKPTVKTVPALGCEAMGSVIGGMTTTVGTKISLKATASKGFVFAGWYEDSVLTIPCDSSIIDYRNPNYLYMVGEEDKTLYARFVPEGKDVAAIYFTMPKECPNGVAITNVSVDVSSCTSLPTVKVAGLPAGLKFTAKSIYKKGSKTEIEVPANTIYGTPTKSGVYTIVATVMTAGNKTATYSQTVIVRKSSEKVVVAECDATSGKATGGGVYVTGKRVALKATANKGYVFAGWYEDATLTTPCDSTLVDYRTASYSYTMGNEDKTFYARFIPASEDSELNLKVNEMTVPTTFTVSEYAQLKFYVDSLSLPKISVKGLPAGMKFTTSPIYKKGSKTEIEVPANTIYGAPTKPGNAEIQVSLSNQSIKKAIVKKFSIEVPNFTAANSYFVDDLDNGIGRKRVLSVGITNIDDILPSLKLNSATAKLAVSGLPAGLKYDAANGKIVGIATKAGTYTVTLTVIDGKAKYVSTITIKVEALPDWVVGTFNGYIDGSESYAGDWVDWVTITITSSGKVSYKDITEDGSIYIVNPKDITFKQNESGDYIIETDQRGIDWYDKKELRISFVIIDGVTVGVIEGESNGADIEDGGAWVQPAIGEFYACQNIWKNAQGTKLAPTFIKNTISSVSMSRMRDDAWDPYYGGYLTLKYGANGAVTTAYSETDGGKATATGSAQLVPYEVEGNITKAWLYTALKPKGRDAFGVLLFLSIDTSNGNVYGDDVVVEDYLLEVDE